MRIVVVGVGGVGGLVGGLLARSGADVAFVARGRQLEALREQGLRVESARGSFSLPSVEVSDDPRQLAPADVVLVAVKAWQVAEIAPSLHSLRKPHGFFVPLQNGVEAAPTLARELGAEHVAGGFCAMLAWRKPDEPGVIQHEGQNLLVVVGERPSGTSQRLQALVTQLTAANIDAEIDTNIEGRLWEKFIFIAAFGAVAAVSRAAAGVVRTQPETRALLIAAMEEIALLARSSGVQLEAGAVARALAHVDGLLPHATASMQRDIQAGRRSELQDQTGAVVRLAAELGVPVPVHQVLWAALLPQELAARDALR